MHKTMGRTTIYLSVCIADGSTCVILVLDPVVLVLVLVLAVGA